MLGQIWKDSKLGNQSSVGLRMKRATNFSACSLRDLSLSRYEDITRKALEQFVLTGSSCSVQVVLGEATGEPLVV